MVWELFKHILEKHKKHFIVHDTDSFYIAVTTFNGYKLFKSYFMNCNPQLAWENSLKEPYTLWCLLLLLGSTI